MRRDGVDVHETLIGRHLAREAADASRLTRLQQMTHGMAAGKLDGSGELPTSQKPRLQRRVEGCDAIARPDVHPRDAGLQVRLDRDDARRRAMTGEEGVGEIHVSDLPRAASPSLSENR